ncbi:MAG: hypothetical protein J4G17_07000 [Anaerolineae bacterium]|nr:hypothetical protein [Anaerolineae bacterium]
MTLRRASGAGLLCILLLAALALDLANQGLAWRTIHALTGEERPLSQLRGMVELAGNLIRVQLDTRPSMPIAHTQVSPYGINVFLEQEVEPAKRARSLEMVAEAGFRWIRQQFPWEDIEIHGRGDFEDRRNLDITGAISAWDKYDQIVALAQQQELDILARLDNPPAWSRADAGAGDQAPPDDLADFENYVRAVAERYRGRIRYWQVWNEPNIYPEWGNRDVDPQAYTQLLCRAHAALKRADPANVVVSGALAPTVAMSGRNLNDYVFLERMYAAGAADCFDVMAAQGYGFNSGPQDRRMRPTSFNFAHNLYIRDLMVAHGDAHKPIWLTEVAWNPIDAVDVPPDVSGRANYGIVTQAQAARYLPGAWRRAQEEWPWTGVLFYWFLKRPGDSERNQSWYYFRMLEPDFTPLPVYESARSFIANEVPTLYPGVHQAESREIEAVDPQLRAQPDAQFGEMLVAGELSFRAHGTQVWARLLRDGAWEQVLLAQSALTQTHEIELSAGAGEGLRVDSIRVSDRAWATLFGPLAALLSGAGMLLWVLFDALRQRRR